MFAKLISLCLLFTLVGAHAEQIKVPIGSQSAERSDISRPTLGMSKASVQQAYGEPLRRNPAKGQPPISSWEYADFTVYFEHDHVLHSVLKTVYHEPTTRVVKETVIIEDTPSTGSHQQKPNDMPEEDLKLNEK